MAGESFLQRLKQGLTKSRENLLQNIGSIFQNRRWDEESLDAGLEWLRESYWLKAPAHLRKAVE